MVDDRRAGSVQTYDDFNIEIHALADRASPIEQRRDRGHRIDAQTAHGIVNIEG